MTERADDASSNVRATSYIIVEGKILCGQCDVVTAVFAFALPAGYESLYVDEDTPDEEGGAWEALGMAVVLSYVEYLPDAVANRIRAKTSHYRLDLDRESGQSFWMNHCEHCGAQMEEEELHGDLDGPFGPIPDEGLEAIQLHHVREAFEAWAGGESYDVKPLDS